jgi:alpha-beta hydrolase superfamily lysophospholipase/SAM-dependent methyltransferase
MGHTDSAAVLAPVRVPEERWFRTNDGVRLFYRYWKGTGPRAVVLVHRGHEHSGRLAHVVEELALPEVSFFAWDMRAHGRSEGEQGSQTTMATFVQDLDEFVRHIGAEFGFKEEQLSVVAQSVGAVIAAAWVHDYAPRIQSMVLAAPAFAVKLYVPFAKLGLGVWHKIYGNFFVKSYVKGKALTHDVERMNSYHTDPLIKLQISARVLLDLYQISARLVEDAGAIRVPTQVLLSGSDWVIQNGPPQAFFNRLDTRDKEIHTFEGFYHDTLGEKDRHLAIAKVRSFLSREFAPRPSLSDADRQSFTKREYDDLRQQLPAGSPKAIAFGLTKLFLNTLGRVSNGIRVGGDTGFDSGSSLDYVYRNKPSGFPLVGPIVDYFYLNSPGWRGIRVRKKLIEELIRSAMDRTRAAGRSVRIVDVAAGHGRYVLEAITASGLKPDDVLLRDFDPDNVAKGRALIAEKKLSARFEQGDAFDRGSLARLQPKPTIGIVSGLFELFPANSPLRETLGGLADAIEPGGYLVYTGQPWHPQLEFIARTLKSHRKGEPWIMRRRTQEELDDLVREAGFRKVAQRIDPEGLFTVSLAERVG